MKVSSGLPFRAFPFDSGQVTAVVTTRHGGVSAGAYGTLNLGGHVGDDPAAVTETRRRLAAALGVDKLTIADQKHAAGRCRGRTWLCRPGARRRRGRGGGASRH